MVTAPVFVIMYYFHPFRLAKSSIAKQNLSHCVNAVCNGSPSRMRRVADFLRNDHTPEVVNAANNASCFHIEISLVC